MRVIFLFIILFLRYLEMVYLVFFWKKIPLASGTRLLFHMFGPFLSFGDTAPFLPWIRP